MKLNPKIERFARKAELAELYDRYHGGSVKAGDEELLDYEEIVNKFAQLIVDECVKVCLEQRDPPTLNYKPSVSTAEAIKRHFL